MTSPLAAALAIALALAGILAIGLPARTWLGRLHIPNPITLLTIGLLIGPGILDLLPDAYLAIDGYLSKAALVVILMRAGLGVSVELLRKVIVSALVLGTLPVAAECVALTVLTHATIFDSWRVALLAGFMIAAVSPAVVIPAMQRQKDLGIGAATSLPDRIMGLTLVNVLVAQMGIFVMIELTRRWEPVSSAVYRLAEFPFDLLLGILGGCAVAWLIPRKLLGDASNAGATSAPRRRAVFALVFAVALAVYFGATALGVESVLAVLAFAISLRSRVDWWDQELRSEWQALWMIAEIVLFITMGAHVQISQLGEGWIVIVLVGIVIAGVGVRLAVTSTVARVTQFPLDERHHLLVSQIPKATVQAVFGALPLKMFLDAGREPLYHDGANLLMLSVVSIVLTAPVGAWLIERSGRQLWARESASAERTSE